MKKLEMKTKNIVNENIEKIGKLFPNVVVETKNGMAIDFDRLKQKLSDDIIEGPKERYQKEMLRFLLILLQQIESGHTDENGNRQKNKTNNKEVK